jgi:cysteine-rich repeat protein
MTAMPTRSTAAPPQCIRCGNGVATPPEQCDDGNTDPADGCTSACTICGDGIVTPPEQCDDGNLIDGDGCSSSCTVPGCGNVVVEGDEECDDAGICIGSANAGTYCTDDAQCPDGTCKTFGGDGCAPNCTLEHDVPFDLAPGQVLPYPQYGVVAGTSGGVIALDFNFPISFPLSGGQTLTIGKEREGQIPVVVKAASVNLRMSFQPDLGCPCIRGVAAKTCGGTLYEPDGTTQSPDCTPGYTAGDSACLGKQPCAFVHGPGNSASGVIGCGGLDGINVSVTQDLGGSSGVPREPVITSCGAGTAGSAVLFTTTAVGATIGCGEGGCGPMCSGSCTDSDPQRPRGALATVPVVTGTASGWLLNAFGTDGNTLGPFSARGAPFSCSALASGSAAGAALVSVASPLLDCVGSWHSSCGPLYTVFISSMVASASGSVTPMLAPTLVPTPTPTHRTNACVGDCNGDHHATVDELITMVNMALTNGPVSHCLAGDGNHDGAITIDELVEAVNNALDGCPVQPVPNASPTFTETAIPPTPTRTVTGTPPTATPTPTTAPTLTPITPVQCPDNGGEQ